ncbi:MAG: hypothetical protein WDA07_09660 [Leucobacter sp.]
MTIEDLVPFWTVSTQVIPVLALAILLEARVIARSGLLHVWLRAALGTDAERLSSRRPV